MTDTCILFNEHLGLAIAELPAQPSASNGGTVGAVFGVLAVVICLTVIGVIFGVVGYSLLKKKSENATMLVVTLSKLVAQG